VGKIASTVTAGLVIGALLWVAQHFNVMPWALGFVLACVANNVRVLSGD